MSTNADILPGETSGATVLFLIRANEAPLTPADTAFLTAAIKMVRLEGLEPPTTGVEAPCSIQLSHKREKARPLQMCQRQNGLIKLMPPHLSTARAGARVGRRRGGRTPQGSIRKALRANPLQAQWP